MTEAEKAYKAAEVEIARVKAEHRTSLSLDAPEFRALESLPPEIRELRWLEALTLDNTQITNKSLDNIFILQALHTLELNNTQIDGELFAYLGVRNNLRTFGIGNKQLIDDDLMLVALLPALENLDLSGSQITDAGLASILQRINLRSLNLANTQISSAGLSNIKILQRMEILNITNTKITEFGLAHLTSQRDLHTLILDKTSIHDLRYLLLFASAQGETNRKLMRLSFNSIPALKLDQHLSKLAEIEDASERTKKTLAYLREMANNWPPLPKRHLTQDSILTIVEAEDGRLDIVPSHPAAEELTDAVKAKAHEKLKQAVNELNQTAGNYHPRLAKLARGLSEHIDCRLADVDMLDVHFELEALRGTFERRGERKGEDVFGDEVVDALDKVLLIGPGLVLDNAAVEKLEMRKDRYRGAMPSADVQKAEDDLSGSIIGNEELFGDNMRGYSVTFVNSEIENSPRLIAGQETLNKNTVIKVGTKIALFIGATVGGTAIVYGTNLGLDWAVANSETILTLAAAWGEAFQAWITPIMMRAKEALAASKEMASKITKN